MSPPSGVALILGALGDFVLALPLLCALRRRGPLALWSRGPYRALLPAALADVPFVDTDGGAGASLFALGQPLAACLVETAQGAEVHAFLSPDAGLGGRLHEAGACAVIWHPPRPTAPPHVVLRGFAEAGLLPPAAVLDTPVMPRAPTGFVVTPSAPAGRRAARPWRAGNTPDWRASVPRRQSAREPSCFIGGVSPTPGRASAAGGEALTTSLRYHARLRDAPVRCLRGGCRQHAMRPRRARVTATPVELAWSAAMALDEPG
jgi:hypothetical protein